MPGYRLPTFNLSANIWHSIDPTSSPGDLPAPDLTVDCNLQAGKKANIGPGKGVYLLVPKLTDIRDSVMFPPNVFDVVECPAGSSRWYVVYWVDDVSKGFPTEYRYAWMFKAADIFTANNDWMWAAPYP